MVKTGSIKRSRIITRTVQYSILCAFFIIMVFPLVVMLTTALKAESEIYMQESFSLLPKAWRFQNFIDAMRVADWKRYFMNSLIVTSIATIGSLFLNSLAGYSFGVLRFPLKNTLFVFLLIGIMVPFQVVIVPQFIIMRSMPLFGGNNILGQGGTGWLDTLWALIIPQLSGSFGIFLCRQFYLNIPYELNESGKMDGCNQFQTFVKIYMPLSKPIYATLGILKSVYVWNDFFYPLIMTNGDNMRTVQLGLQSYSGFALVRWELMMAATFIVCLPLLLAFFLFQRYFIQTAASTGMKG
jgi:multiple sugar transport system permease protein